MRIRSLTYPIPRSAHGNSVFDGSGDLKTQDEDPDEAEGKFNITINNVLGAYGGNGAGKSLLLDPAQGLTNIGEFMKAEVASFGLWEGLPPEDLKEMEETTTILKVSFQGLDPRVPREM